jgi:hypothetical protein
MNKEWNLEDDDLMDFNPSDRGMERLMSCCESKKCCKKYLKKGRHCKKCPKR